MIIGIKISHIINRINKNERSNENIVEKNSSDFFLPNFDWIPDTTGINAELSDPRFADGWWQEQINMMLEVGKKAEQQSLAKYGLDFVTETYLPEKLQQLGL